MSYSFARTGCSDSDDDDEKNDKTEEGKKGEEEKKISDDDRGLREKLPKNLYDDFYYESGHLKRFGRGNSIDDYKLQSDGSVIFTFSENGAQLMLPADKDPGDQNWEKYPKTGSQPSTGPAPTDPPITFYD